LQRCVNAIFNVLIFERDSADGEGMRFSFDILLNFVKLVHLRTVCRKDRAVVLELADEVGDVFFRFLLVLFLELSESLFADVEFLLGALD